MKKAMVLAVLALAGSLSAETQYFPERAFCSSEKEPGKCERWYVKHLQAMAEPSLLEGSKDSERQVYRFLWLRSFHHPICARLEIKKEDGSGRLFITVLSGAGGYEPGQIAEQHVINVPHASVDKFQKLLNKANFWNAPSELPLRTDLVELDGAQWIMEGVKGGFYNVVDRWSPGGSYQRAALFLVIKLGGLHIPKSEVY